MSLPPPIRCHRFSLLAATPLDALSFVYFSLRRAARQRCAARRAGKHRDADIAVKIPRCARCRVYDAGECGVRDSVAAAGAMLTRGSVARQRADYVKTRCANARKLSRFYLFDAITTPDAAFRQSGAIIMRHTAPLFAFDTLYASDIAAAINFTRCRHAAFVRYFFAGDASVFCRRAAVCLPAATIRSVRSLFTLTPFYLPHYAY